MRVIAKTENTSYFLNRAIEELESAKADSDPIASTRRAMQILAMAIVNEEDNVKSTFVGTLSSGEEVYVNNNQKGKSA